MALPQSQWPEFQPPMCVCGHPAGDHRGVGTPHSHFPLRGVCSRCECPGFVEVKPEKAA